jgi:hypothetical protein
MSVDFNMKTMNIYIYIYIYIQKKNLLLCFLFGMRLSFDLGMGDVTVLVSEPRLLF